MLEAKPPTNGSTPPPTENLGSGPGHDMSIACISYEHITINHPVLVISRGNTPSAFLRQYLVDPFWESIIISYEQWHNYILGRTASVALLTSLR